MRLDQNQTNFGMFSVQLVQKLKTKICLKIFIVYKVVSIFESKEGLHKTFKHFYDFYRFKKLFKILFLQTVCKILSVKFPWISVNSLNNLKINTAAGKSRTVLEIKIDIFNYKTVLFTRIRFLF